MPGDDNVIYAALLARLERLFGAAHGNFVGHRKGIPLPRPAGKPQFVAEGSVLGNYVFVLFLLFAVIIPINERNVFGNDFFITFGQVPVFGIISRVVCGSKKHIRPHHRLILIFIRNRKHFF